MRLDLRQCHPSDLTRLAEISRKTFADAFEKDNRPDDFEAYTDGAFNTKTLSEDLRHPYTTFYFAFKDNDLVGYLKLNENEAQTDLRSEKGMELERIYVLEEFQGEQIGGWMLDQAKQLASYKGKSFLWLGVWEKNPRAIRLYQKHGFSKFGTHPYYIGSDKQTDWLMRFDLNA